MEITFSTCTPKKNFSNFQSGRWKESAVYPESENHPFRQREGTYRGLTIRWPQFAGGISRSRRNQRLLSFQHDILCTSVLEVWGPTKLTLDQQKLLAVHWICRLFCTVTRYSHTDMSQRFPDRIAGTEIDNIVYPDEIKWKHIKINDN